MASKSDDDDQAAAAKEAVSKAFYRRPVNGLSTPSDRGTPNYIPVSEMCIPVTDTFQCEHKNKTLFPVPYCSTIIYGASGTGKTRLLCQILPALSDKIHILLIASCVNGNQVHQGLMDYYQKKHWIVGKFESPTPLLESLKTLVANKELTHEKNGLIIFDDWNPGAKGMLAYKSAMDMVVSQYRNHGLHVVILTQSPQMISTATRNNCSTVITFQLQNKTCRTVHGWDCNVPDREEYHDLMDDLDQFIELPYCFRWHTQRPLTIGCGIGNRMEVLADHNSIKVPNVRETMARLYVDNQKELNQKAASLQKAAGNDAPQLSSPAPSSEKSETKS
jgi:hypothetical protein